MTISTRSRENDPRVLVLRRNSIFVHDWRKNEGNRGPRISHLLDWGTSCMYKCYILNFLSREWLLLQRRSYHTVLYFLRQLHLFCGSNRPRIRQAFLQ